MQPSPILKRISSSNQPQTQPLNSPAYIPASQKFQLYLVIYNNQRMRMTPYKLRQILTKQQFHYSSIKLHLHKWNYRVQFLFDTKQHRNQGIEQIKKIKQKYNVHYYYYFQRQFCTYYLMEEWEYRNAVNFNSNSLGNGGNSGFFGEEYDVVEPVMIKKEEQKKQQIKKQEKDKQKGQNVNNSINMIQQIRGNQKQDDKIKNDLNKQQVKLSKKSSSSKQSKIIEQIKSINQDKTVINLPKQSKNIELKIIPQKIQQQLKQNKQNKTSIVSQSSQQSQPQPSNKPQYQQPIIPQPQPQPQRHQPQAISAVLTYLNYATAIIDQNVNKNQINNQLSVNTNTFTNTNLINENDNQVMKDQKQQKQQKKNNQKISLIKQNVINTNDNDYAIKDQKSQTPKLNQSDKNNSIQPIDKVIINKLKQKQKIISVQKVNKQSKQKKDKDKDKDKQIKNISKIPSQVQEKQKQKQISQKEKQEEQKKKEKLALQKNSSLNTKPNLINASTNTATTDPKKSLLPKQQPKQPIPNNISQVVPQQKQKTIYQPFINLYNVRSIASTTTPTSTTIKQSHKRNSSKTVIPQSVLQLTSALQAKKVQQQQLLLLTPSASPSLSPSHIKKSSSTSNAMTNNISRRQRQKQKQKFTKLLLMNHQLSQKQKQMKDQKQQQQILSEIRENMKKTIQLQEKKKQIQNILNNQELIQQLIKFQIMLLNYCPGSS